MGRWVGIWGILACVLCLASFASGYEEGYVYKVHVEDVFPTQAAIGHKEIDIKVRDIRRAIAKDKFEELREDKTGKAVIGPDGELYLIDGHHFAVALLEAGKKKMLVKVKKDYSDLSWSEFWEKMEEKGYCHLFDEEGDAITHRQLPKSFKKLKDDRYRALAWLVREAKGFRNLDIPFQEFHWANHFRSRVRFAGKSYDSWEKALLKAMDLAASKDAKGLPGYTGKAGDCSAMLALLAELEES